MEILESVNKLLDYAIECEQNAHDFYLELSKKCEFPGLKEVLENFAKEELGHRKKLAAIKEGRISPAKFGQKVMDLDIADYLEDVDPETDRLDYQNILIIAMKKEKSSFRLYTKLAESTNDPEIRGLLESLANDEARHKLRFELEYDEFILKDN